MYRPNDEITKNTNINHSDSVAQREEDQTRGYDLEDDRPEMLQLKSNRYLTDNRGVSSVQPVQEKVSNNTGLPDGLKSGMELVSGYDLGHVKVHYNSPKPAAVQAHAYAQGSDILLGAGQERHLPHELGHVVQQMQGEVKVTKQVAGVGINDDVGLERGADRLGEMALQRVSNGGAPTDAKSITLTPSIQVDKQKENKSRAVANSVVRNNSNGKQGFGFVDNQPEAIAQRKLNNILSGNNGVIQCQSKDQEWDNAGEHKSQGQTNPYKLVNTLNNKYAGVIVDNSTKIYHNGHGMGKTFGGSDDKDNINAWIGPHEDRWTDKENDIREGGAELVEPRSDEQGTVTTDIAFQAGVYTRILDDVFDEVKPELKKPSNWEKAAPAVTKTLDQANLDSKEAHLKSTLKNKMDNEVKDALEQMPETSEIKYESTSPDNLRTKTWTFNNKDEMAKPEKGTKAAILTFISTNKYAPSINGWKLKSGL